MKNNFYITSPYIRLKIKSKKHFLLLDYLSDKMVPVSAAEYFLLKKYLKGKPLIATDPDFNLTKKLIENHLLLNPYKWDSKEGLRRVEIETTTLCNWNCEYCPSTYKKRKTHVLGLKEFCAILDECTKYNKIETVCLHIYNEPTLDPFFFERINEIKKRNLWVEIFTNGSMLSKDKCEHLADSGIVKKVVINFPSLIQEEFTALTGSHLFHQTVHNIDTACSYGLPVFITILSKSEKNTDDIQTRFPRAIVHSMQAQNRAGTLTNKTYDMNINLTDSYLFGCFYFSQILYVNSYGDCFPCINDCLNLHYKYGNILKDDLNTIYSGQVYEQLKNKIFGLLSPEPSFMCRKCIFMKQNKHSFNTTWYAEEKKI